MAGFVVVRASLAQLVASTTINFSQHACTATKPLSCLLTSNAELAGNLVQERLHFLYFGLHLGRFLHHMVQP